MGWLGAAQIRLHANRHDAKILSGTRPEASGRFSPLNARYFSPDSRILFRQIKSMREQQMEIAKRLHPLVATSMCVCVCPKHETTRTATDKASQIEPR